MRGERFFELIWSDLHDGEGGLLDAAKFVGRCPEQVEEFVEDEVKPAIERYAKELLYGQTTDIKV